MKEYNIETKDFCNLYVFGKNGSGKSWFIEELLKQMDLKFLNSNQFYSTYDALLIDENYEVNIQFKEIRSFDEIDKFHRSNGHGMIFLVIINVDYFNDNIYEKEFLNKVAKIFPDAIVYFVLLGNMNKNFISNSNNNLKIEFRINLNSITPKMNKTIRDIFLIVDYGDEEFYFFRKILKNSILNHCTDRLLLVKQKIEKSIINESEKLDLGKSGITSLYEIPELFNCVNLKELILSNEWSIFKNNKWHREYSDNHDENNIISFIPNEIKKLEKLEKIIIGGDWNLEKKKYYGWRIKSLTPLLSLSNLNFINISNNKISSINNLDRLRKLEIIHLNNNKINALHFDQGLNSLKEIYLSNNFLTNINFLERYEFRSLKTLDVHANKIKDLEPIKRIIEKIGVSNSKWEKNTINISKNPLIKPPMEIVNIGKNAVLKYFEDINVGKHYINNEIKLILVGNSEVGKTTLAKYLDNENELNLKHNSTHWLEERKLTSKHLLDKIKQKCTINLFDFGGHDFFHDTHHLFFSSNTIYILLWDVYSNCLNKRISMQVDSMGIEKEVEFQDFPLNYWLDSIKYYVREDNVKVFDFQIDNNNEYNSDVLVVQNKVTNQNGIVFLNSEELKESYPFIYDFINVSILEKRRTDYFDLVLSEMLSNMQIIGAKLPGYYGKIKDSISLYNGNAIISTKDFVDFCNSIKGVNIDIEQAKILANYLNQVGVILYYPNSKNKELIYIDKKWVINKIYVILEGLYDKGGEFDDLYLDYVFGNSLDNIQKNNILKLMMDFKIIFKNPYSNNYIAPLYLPEKPMQLMEMFIDSNKKPYRKFLFEGFIHKNIILNIFQEYGELVIREKKGNNIYYYYWKNGLIIKDPSSNEIVKIVFNIGDDEGNASIDLYKINYENDSNFVFQLINNIIEISKKYDVQELITMDGLDYIPLSVIHKNEENENWTFLFNDKYYKLTDFKKYLKKPTVVKKIFISYSKQDLKLVNKFIEHLTALQLDGKVSYWYCSELEAGSEWNDEIQKNFDDSDIICFMISPNFMKTKYIHEHEIARAFERKDKEPNLKIVPIILDFCRWTTVNNNLGKFTGLPYTAKPVVDFDNQNMAWYIIEECLRLMIEKDLNPEGNDFYKEHLPSDILKIYERIIDGSVNK
ncbi:COR domain-containing protein [Flavobacterium sp.]|jgi:internalin A|uniref:COR domain-containing protein n=1 Tax=Flavobacterium sp. TaxID=239 RepID=UPI0037BF83AD